MPMAYSLTPKQRAFQEKVRALTREKVAPGAEEREEKAEFPWWIPVLIALIAGLIGGYLYLRKRAPKGVSTDGSDPSASQGSEEGEEIEVEPLPPDETGEGG